MAVPQGKGQGAHRVGKVSDALLVELGRADEPTRIDQEELLRAPASKILRPGQRARCCPTPEDPTETHMAVVGVFAAVILSAAVDSLTGPQRGQTHLLCKSLLARRG